MKFDFIFLSILFSKLLCAAPFIWIVNDNGETTVIDATTNLVATSMCSSQGMLRGPVPITFSPDGKFVYVANYSSPASVSTFDTSTYNVIATIPLSGVSEHLAADPSCEYIYAANAGTNTVDLINTSNYEVISIASDLFNQPKAIAYSKDGSSAYVANYGNHSVCLIDTEPNCFYT